MLTIAFINSLDYRFLLRFSVFCRSRYGHYLFQKYTRWGLEQLFVEAPLAFYTRVYPPACSVTKVGRLAPPKRKELR